MFTKMKSILCLSLIFSVCALQNLVLGQNDDSLQQKTQRVTKINLEKLQERSSSQQRETIVPTNIRDKLKIAGGGSSVLETVVSSRLTGDRCSLCVKEPLLQHYERRGCKPNRSRECDCVKYYTCPTETVIRRTLTANVESTLNKISQQSGKCHYQGATYSIGEAIRFPNEPCRLCYCSQDYSKSSRLVEEDDHKKHSKSGQTSRSSVETTFVHTEMNCQTSDIECPETVFGQQARPGCYFSYEDMQCCGKHVCPNELAMGDVHHRRCHVDGRQYRYGEKMVVKSDACLQCVCNQAWIDSNHRPSNGSCTRSPCDELDNPELAGCTPIYFEDGCCPIDFVCPSKLTPTELRALTNVNDGRERENREAESTDRLSSNKSTCKLGSATIELAKSVLIKKDQTEHERVCARCSCKVPPLLTCVARPSTQC